MAKQTTAEVFKNGPAQLSALGIDKEPQPQQAAIADVSTAPTAAQHNAVLAVLRAFGLIAT